MRTNSMITGDRRLSLAPSRWERGFACAHVRPLIVCRGPIRKEALDVFREMGIEHSGILLSEKDSIVYTHALAPELRQVPPEHVHRVRDYSGATKEEREQRTQEIIAIARAGGYTHVFAGYGFMAEDEGFVRAIETAGLRFIGPRSTVQAAAGHKDEAKRTALQQRVSVTPGINNAAVRTLLRKRPDLGGREDLAEAALERSYREGVDLFTVDELCAELTRCAAELFAAHPGRRVRLKAIGGGGGKGQRITTAAEQAAGAAREILAEVKALGAGDNKNILLELNIEQTRHNEIQLIGNGAWCLALGGRDCSLQMHEQKLLEVSITSEGLQEAAARARAEGRAVEARVLEQDLLRLQRMEEEGERFGQAVGLDSASTFECIVDGDVHYFMEVNTRIQVEHRVTELCYALRFRDPADPAQCFEVTSLVECMVLLSEHGPRLPRPERVLRQGAAVEARLNATDRSLSPHAGGVIIGWSDPIEHEIRDDQGICQKNPDTGQFVRYRLAGAYDSNIALLVTYGADRQEAYQRLWEIERRARLRGQDLQTNLEFHYGLLTWFLSRSVWAKPTTRFVVPYLTQVGLLLQEAERVDLHWLWAQRCADWERRVPGAATRAALLLKETLLKRVMERLLRDPHLLSAWLSGHRSDFVVEGERVRWLKNPLALLQDTYWLLNMEPQPGAAAAHVIWDHDEELLQRGLGFYARLRERLGRGEISFAALEEILAAEAPPAGLEDALWQRVRASHLGFQCGLELLKVLPLLGARCGFEELAVGEDLEIRIPARLLDPALQAAMKKVLVPPVGTRADLLLAESGGMFYAQEAPDRPPLVKKGDHFQAGQPLYIIEVMKMFNRVHAPFSGTVVEVLMEGGEGTIVQKGQPLFRVRPDEQPTTEDGAARARRVREASQRYLDAM